MNVVKDQQNNPGQEWQKADARILGQILAAQNVLFALPDTSRIAEFYAQTLVTIPGITACRVCLGNKSVQAGDMENGVCSACETLQNLAREKNVLNPTASAFICKLADQSGMHVIAIDSFQHRFGLFVLQIDQAAPGALYQPFINNLSNYVALVLENRWQKELLQKANNELEHKVAVRTEELNAANARLRQELADRKQTEAALLKSETLLNATQRQAKIGGWDWDIELQTSFWTEETYRIHGFLQQAFMSVPPEVINRSLTCYDPNDRPVIMAAFQRCLQQGDGYDLEFPFTAADGCRKWIRTTGSAVREKGRIIKVVGTIMDITQRKRAEVELRKLNDELEQRVSDRTAELSAANAKLLELDRLKSLFIASMSHELRTPLNSIIGFSSIMLNEWTGPLNEEQRENMAAVHRSGKHLLSLINDVIDVSKIETGKIESFIEDFDVHEMVLEAAETIRMDIEKKGLVLKVQACRYILHTDRRRLLQCLLNLLSNATKFTVKGSIGVNAELSADGSKVIIAVEDTGIGIGEDDLGRLFSPFVRFQKPGESVIPGTGLGLYLTQKLLKEILKGDMLVTSTPGAGSRFTMRVPIEV